MTGVTVHGFRSSFRQWSEEQTSFPKAVCELALSHEPRKIASEMGRPAIIKALRKKAAQMSKEKGKERAIELVEEFTALRYCVQLNN